MWNERVMGWQWSGAGLPAEGPEWLEDVLIDPADPDEPLIDLGDATGDIPPAPGR